MNSKDYWLNRETEALKRRIQDEREYERQIKQIYADMLDAVQKEITSFYGKYAGKEGITIAEAKKRVSQLDIKAYERKARRYVKKKDFSKKANEEMRLYNLTMKVNRLEMLKANIGIELVSGHDELEKFMGDVLQDRTMDELTRQAGILGKTVRNNAAKAHAIVNGSFHNGTFSDRIWQYQDIMREDLAKLLQTGLIQGKNPRALAKDLRKYWYGNDPRTGGGAVYCMERLMRTELARVQTEAQKQSFIRNGFEMYTFIVNGGCCDICEGLSGKHFRVDRMMPGENAPPMHPHCRCSTAAYEDTKEYEDWLNYLSVGGTTKDWQKYKKTVDESGNGDIINKTEMFKKSVDPRDDFKFISDKQFEDMTAAVKKLGAVIDRGTPEIEEHLKSLNATASSIGKFLMFMRDVCVSEVLEETRHFMQNIEKLNDDKGEPLRTYLNEIDAKNYVLNYDGKYKVPRNERDAVQEELDRYKKLLEDYEGSER